MTLEELKFAVQWGFPTTGCLQVPESVAGREPFAQLAKLMEVTGGMGWFYDQRPGS